MGVLVICRSPGLIVVEGRTAFTIGASSVVLADADVMDLGKGPPDIQISGLIIKGLSQRWTGHLPPTTQGPAQTPPPPALTQLQ